MASGGVEFVYKLDGEVTEINVFELAPTLLALGELIQQANKTAFPDGREIAVNVKPFREGSFNVDVVVAAASTLQALLDIANSQQAQQIKTLLEWVGLINGVGIGAIALLKALKGKPASVEQLNPGEVRYTSSDGQTFTVNINVHNIVQNTNVQQNIRQVFLAPLSRPDVDAIRTFIAGEPETEETVTEDDAWGIDEFTSQEETATPVPEEITKETLHYGVFLNPKRGAFDGDPRDWSFKRGEEIITATIKDDEFLRKHHRLDSSDLLTVDLVEKQKVVGTVVKKPVYEIVRVTNYVKGPDQDELFQLRS
jgi:hypothetical protein